MSFLDRLFGGDDARRQQSEARRPPDSQQSPSQQSRSQQSPSQQSPSQGSPRRLPGTDRGAAGSDAGHERSPDEIALQRYRYLLRTAPPGRIEQAHAEAFSHLTSDQRRRVFVGLARELPPEERPLSADPSDLARAATRAELRSPGAVEKLLTRSDAGAPPVAAGVDGSSGSALATNGYRGHGASFGSMFAGSLLGSVAGYVIASTVMSAFVPADWGDSTEGSGGSEGDGDGADTGSSDPGAGAAGYDAGADGGYQADAGGADWAADSGGGDFGGFGGDFGGFDI